MSDMNDAAIDALVTEGKAECQDCPYSREGCDWHQGYEQGLREGARLAAAEPQR